MLSLRSCMSVWDALTGSTHHLYQWFCSRKTQKKTSQWTSRRLPSVAPVRPCHAETSCSVVQRISTYVLLECDQSTAAHWDGDNQYRRLWNVMIYFLSCLFLFVNISFQSQQCICCSICFLAKLIITNAINIVTWAQYEGTERLILRTDFFKSPSRAFLCHNSIFADINYMMKLFLDDRKTRKCRRMLRSFVHHIFDIISGALAFALSGQSLAHPEAVKVQLPPEWWLVPSLDQPYHLLCHVWHWLDYCQHLLRHPRCLLYVASKTQSLFSRTISQWIDNPWASSLMAEGLIGLTGAVIIMV